jgi:tetratricopeptide (TPR) repeat protein
MNLSLQQSQKLTKVFEQAQKAEKTGQLFKAERLYLDMLKIAPHLPLARAHLAFIYRASKRPNEAVAQFEKILLQAPTHAQTHFNLANLYYELEQSENAIKHYELSIQFEPNLIDAYINCAIAWRLVKNTDEAIQYLYQALNLDNKNSRAFHVLGAIYQELEDLPRALECFENASSLDPKESKYRVSFAEALIKVGFDFEAGLELHKACEYNPSYADSFIGYGEYLYHHQRYDEALECYLHALKLTPKNINMQDRLGKTYLAMNDIDNALKYYNTALSKEPNRLTSLAGKGQIFLESGNVNAGLEASKKIIAIDPYLPTGYILQSRLTKSTQDDGLIEQLIKFTKREDLSEEFKIPVYFSLGKILDDQKNYQDAFKYYTVGNALKNNTLNYSPEEDEAKFDNLINFFSADFFKQHQHLGNQSNLPIVIVGMPRSGTTLTEQIISSHPQVIGAGEVAFWGRTPTALPHKLNTTTPYPQCLNEINQLHVQEIAHMYETTLRKIAGPNTQPLNITDKLPHNFLNIGLISLIFPNVKIIHTKRDAMDTCLSIFFQNFNDPHPYAYSLENLSFHYQQYQRIMRHWHEVLPGRILDINYEETTEDPEYWSRQLISHIGLDWDDSCLAPHKLERSIKTASHWQVRQPIYKTSVQRWKKYDAQLVPLKKTLGIYN